MLMRPEDVEIGVATVVIAHICNAVKYLQDELRLVHCDIKPAVS